MRKALAENDSVITGNKASHKLVGSFVGRMQKPAVSEEMKNPQPQCLQVVADLVGG